MQQAAIGGDACFIVAPIGAHTVSGARAAAETVGIAVARSMTGAWCLSVFVQISARKYGHRWMGSARFAPLTWRKRIIDHDLVPLNDQLSQLWNGSIGMDRVDIYTFAIRVTGN